MTVKQNRWKVSGGMPDMERVFEEKLGLHPVIARLLVNRGMENYESAKHFLENPISSLLDPFGMKDMGKAADRVLKAYDNKERVVVYGDYDVDGVTATSVLIRFFKSLGMDADYYIPERAKEGYGLNRKAIEKISNDGAELLITVDNGITAVDEAVFAKELGLDLIITDHHQPEDILPDALAVVDHQRKDCGYEEKNLCGAGVAFKLAMAVRTLLYKRGVPKKELPNLKKLLSLVAIGTVADVVSITGENRVIVTHGLAELDKTENIGLMALKRVSGVKGQCVTTTDIGFAMAPRINAAGRLKRADICVKLLAVDCGEAVANSIADELDSENKRRREIQKGIFDEALQEVEKNFDPKTDRGIVLSSDDWSAGIIGIVASKLSEKFNVPAVIISFKDGDPGRGSGRSIDGFNLLSGLTLCSESLVAYGGHKMAAGVTIGKDSVEKFKQLFLKASGEAIDEEMMRKVIDIDCEIDAEVFDKRLVESVESLAPFGCGAPHPVFLSRDTKVLSGRFMGAENQHIKFFLESGVEAVGFNMAEKFANETIDGEKFDIVYIPEINRWRGFDKVQFRLLDAIKS